MATKIEATGDWLIGKTVQYVRHSGDECLRGEVDADAPDFDESCLPRLGDTGKVVRLEMHPGIASAEDDPALDRWIVVDLGKDDGNTHFWRDELLLTENHYRAARVVNEDDDLEGYLRSEIPLTEGRWWDAITEADDMHGVMGWGEGESETWRNGTPELIAAYKSGDRMAFIAVFTGTDIIRDNQEAAAVDAVTVTII